MRHWIALTNHFPQYQLNAICGCWNYNNTFTMWTTMKMSWTTTTTTTTTTTINWKWQMVCGFGFCCSLQFICLCFRFVAFYFFCVDCKTNCGVGEHWGWVWFDPTKVRNTNHNQQNKTNKLTSTNSNPIANGLRLTTPSQSQHNIAISMFDSIIHVAENPLLMCVRIRQCRCQLAFDSVVVSCLWLFLFWQSTEQQNNETTKQQNNKTTKQQNNKTTKPILLTTITTERSHNHCETFTTHQLECNCQPIVLFTFALSFLEWLGRG